MKVSQKEKPQEIIIVFGKQNEDMAKRPQCDCLHSTLFGDYVVGMLSVGTLTEAHIKNVNKTVISSLCQGHNTQSIHCFPL